jgi:hypothetical protein
MHSLPRYRAPLLGVLLLLAALFATPIPAQGQVRIVVDRDFVNIRIVPALGAELVGTANAGTTFVATGRSPDNEWLQIQFAGQEAWIGTVVVAVLEGDINSLPIRDPRSIPYGGQDAPRAGFTTATSDFLIRLPNSGVRVRSGPSTAYLVLADAPRFTEMAALGRTPNNQHIQVNFQGTLGWIPVQFIEIIGNRTILELPIDGVVAEEAPLSFENENAFFGILRRMRDRLDLAQVSLNSIQGTWTDAALGIPPVCAAYPARPTDFNIPRAIYAEYFALLDPLLRDFNASMAEIRASIDLLIESCGRPNPDLVLTSPPVTTGGLELANAADSRMAGLRRRIDELLPELGPDDCVFAFSGRVDILPALDTLLPPTFDTVFFDLLTDEFTPAELTKGYCFDATQINIGRIELLRRETNYGIILAVAPIDDPTNFIATAAAGPSTFEGANLVLFPISFPKDGRYLIIVDAEIEPGETPEGEFTLLISDFSVGTPQNTALTFDENGEIVLQNINFSSESGEGGTVFFEGPPPEADTPVDDGTGNNGGGVTTIDSPLQPGDSISNDSGVATSLIQSPSFDDPVEVAVWQPGEIATVISVITGDWYFLELPNGDQGWINLVSVGGDENDTTDANPEPSVDTASEPSTESNAIPQPAATPQLVSTPPPTTGGVCPGVTLTCDELFSCLEVQACANAGSTLLDPNGNGVACDGNDGTNPLGCNVAVP